MSSGVRISFEEAAVLARRLEDLLNAACNGLVVAGSFRRRAETVGDLELVAVPKLVPERQGGLFGAVGYRSLLWDLVDELIADDVGLERHPPQMVGCSTCGGAGIVADLSGCTRCGSLGKVERAAPWGDKYRKLLFCGVSVDLFTAAPESWGAQLLIRTGPADFSQAWVTELRRYGLQMKDGQVLDSKGAVVPVRDEAAAFALVRWAMRPANERGVSGGQ